MAKTKGGSLRLVKATKKRPGVHSKNSKPAKKYSGQGK